MTRVLLSGAGVNCWGYVHGGGVCVGPVTGGRLSGLQVHPQCLLTPVSTLLLFQIQVHSQCLLAPVRVLPLLQIQICSQWQVHVVFGHFL